MITRKLSAGDIIEARCTKCREVMNHRIVAMVGEKVVRVECNTCRGIHNYRQPAEAKVVIGGKSTGKAASKTVSPPRKTKKDPDIADKEEWESLLPSMQVDQAIMYEMNAKFKLNDLVQHTAFGIGLVTLIVKPNKMHVLFQGGKKLLRCGV
ncbi:MAG: hypothetical protein WCG31_05460 [Deltaproteobacteria bacterium]